MSPTLVADQVCAAAGELARRAAVAEAGESAVGAPLGVQAEGERLVVHYFACQDPAYRGWRWSVTVARASRAGIATVCEVVLEPGADAVLAPDWVPWQQRLRPGDLGIGDLLPATADDPRLVPSFFAVEDPTDEAGEWQPPFQLGFGRARVLSPTGRDEASIRWQAGEAGPASPIARAAPAACGSCGFFLPLSGVLGQAFGVCANAFAPDDGRVVAVDHGCGAHSEAVEQVSAAGSVADTDAAELLGHS